MLNPELKPEILTISALNRAVAGVLERSFPLVWVSGEISNLTRASSGHWYFTLKDDAASARAVMFKGRNQALNWVPREGDRIEARVLVSLYAPRGDYQLNVEQLRRAGQGSLHEQFMRLKEKLAAEGWFAVERKLPLPVFPRRIGVITSPQAAALHDVLTALQRRAPHVQIIIYPTAVQGAEAPDQIRRALQQANQRQECDVVLLVRGGGSLEDLWAFNDEQLVREVAQSALPVISGVGHETDITLVDFAASLRAPTPTAAAELAAPARTDCLQTLQRFAMRMQHQQVRWLRERSMALDYWQRRLLTPNQQIQRLHQQIFFLAQRMQHAFASQQQHRQRQLTHLRQGLAWLNPQHTLQRGYSIVRTEQGEIVRQAQQVQDQQSLQVLLAEGELKVAVISKH